MTRFTGIVIRVFLFFAPLVLVSAGTTQRIVVFGDSITAGYGLAPDNAFPARLQSLLNEEGFPVEVVNAGLSGETSAGGLRRADWVFRQPIDILILELGANDGLRGIDPAITRANLQGIIDRLRDRHPEARILLAGMFAPPNMGPEYARAFAATFTSLAETNKIPLMPFILEDVAGDPALNLEDGIHPTAEGHRIIARNLLPYLRPLLRDPMSAP